MENLFEQNLALLKKGNQALGTRLDEEGESSSIAVIEARDGSRVPELTRGGRKVYIHSRFAPVKEAERLISETHPHQFDLFIVFGFGFGYHVEELLKGMGRDTTLLVFERSMALLRQAMVSRDLSFILSDSRFHLFVDPDEDDLAAALKGKSSYRVTFITHRGSFQIDPGYYSNLLRLCRSYLSTKEVNIATLARFEKTWSANIARNIERFIACPGANIYYERFRGIPALVVSAGPSLLQSLDFIRQHLGSAVVICVDTSYRILRANGIEPHFCISVDPQVVNARYFEGDTGGRTVLIADPTVHPSVFRLFKGRCAITGLAFQMMKWIEEIAGEKGAIAYGGSVSTNAYDFAKRLGASPVILIGQDLAFTGGLAHARGSYLDEQVHLRTNRFSTFEMFNRRQLTALPKISIRGIRTPRVITNQKMMIFLSWFEKRNDPDLLNATDDGAFMNSVQHCPAGEVPIGERDEDFFSLIHQSYEEQLHRQVDAVRDEMRRAVMERCGEVERLLPVLRKAVALSDELVKHVRVRKKDSRRLEYLLAQLSDLDAAVQAQSRLTDMIGFTIQRVVHTITEGYELDDDAAVGEEERIAKRSAFLYSGLLEGCLFIRKVLHTMEQLLVK